MSSRQILLQYSYWNYLNNVSMTEISKNPPVNLAELAAISGIGETKVYLYNIISSISKNCFHNHNNCYCRLE